MFHLKIPKMNWSEFSRKIRVKCSIEDAYLAWADTEKMRVWFLATCQIEDSNARSIVTKGDSVKWEWHNYPNTMLVEILESRPNEYIEFSFGDPMKVSVQFSSEDEYTVIELRQFDIPTDETSRMNFHVGCRQAWSTWMLNLKAWLEHGILLHDKELGKREDLFHYVNT